MNKHVYIQGVSLANYRGFGDDANRIGLFQRFNFFIGPNNAGKSSVLSAIHGRVPALASPDRSAALPFSNLDITLGRTTTQVKIGIGVKPCDIIYRVMSLSPLDKHAHKKIYELLLNKLLAPCTADGLAWFTRDGGKVEVLKPLSFLSPEHGSLRDEESTIRSLWGLITGMQAGNLRIWLDAITQHVLGHVENVIRIPSVALIPAIREISAPSEERNDWSGKGLIRELVRLQNPGHDEQDRKQKFESINKFLQAVTDNSSARIEIPYTLTHVLVHMDGKTLPIAALGTGIHEVVILAAVCTLLENQIICIEEPEIHLHPLLQRRLMNYLEKETKNQYFIATHSATIIDAVDAAVFQVSNHNGRTIANIAQSSSSRFKSVRALGYRASDLLQSNAIVWVEGPSDRLYLKHWIFAVDNSLQEGIQYSIMFYGGRLLSHLTTSDNEGGNDDVEALIAVRRLNRHLGVVIDSDRRKLGDAINATKTRVISELLDEGGIGWMTEGREVENYVAVQLMTNALKTVYPKRFGTRLKKGQYDDVLPFKTPNGDHVKIVDKVKVALAVCAQPAELDVLDLRQRIQKMVLMINEANQ